MSLNIMVIVARIAAEHELFRRLRQLFDQHSDMYCANWPRISLR